MKPVWVIANPTSARGKAGSVLPRLERRLGQRGIEFQLHRTNAPGHARQLGQEARDAASKVLIVGGDGTIHEVADGLLGDEPPIGGACADLPPIAVLPVGTGNDFFRMVRAPSSMMGAVRALEYGVPRRFEVGEASWDGGSRAFVNLVGVGVDVEVLRRRPAFARLPGLLQYLGALAAALRHFKPTPLRVMVGAPAREERLLTGPVLLSAVTVGPSVGGGFILSPKARPDDGLLDLFHVGPLGPLMVLRYLPGILRGKGIDRPDVSSVQVSQVRIERSDGAPLLFELDGEVMETSTRFLDIQVRPGSLLILESPTEAQEG